MIKSKLKVKSWWCWVGTICAPRNDSNFTKKSEEKRNISGKSNQGGTNFQEMSVHLPAK